MRQWRVNTPVATARSHRARTHVYRSSRRALHDDYYTNREFRDNRAIVFIVAAIAIVLLVQSIFQVPFLRLTKLEVRGLEYQALDDVEKALADELRRSRFIFFRNDNFFLFRRTRLVRRLQNDFFLDIVRLTRRFPNALTLEVRERIAGFVLQSGDHYIRIDGTGAVLGPVEQPSSRQGIIVDERSIPEAAIPIDYLEKVTDISDLWSKNVSTLGLTAVHLTDEPGIIIVSTGAGYRIYFSRDKDIAKQVSRLVVFLGDPAVTQPKEYLDLRFDETIYLR